MTDRAYHGGRVFSEDAADAPADPKLQRRRYPCFADGCPMPGTMWATPSTSKPGACVYHYAAVEGDIPRITHQLQAWDCVAREIDRARAVLTGATANDARAQNAEFALAWGRLQPMLDAGWEKDLRPDGMEYGAWAKHLERFLGARIVEALSQNRSGARR